MKRLAARLAARMRAWRGWRGAAFDFFIGALSALGFAPFGLFPLLLVGYAALVLRLDATVGKRRPIRAGFASGWWFGFGQFLVGLHWIGYAFMVDAASHAWQLPFVAVLFPGGLALFPAVAGAVAAKFWRSGSTRVFVFTFAFALCEWLRGHVLTGFPWNVTGYGWGAVLPIMQGAALVGTYGLGLLTILFGASLAELIGVRPRWRLPAAMAGLFTALGIFGLVRLAMTPTGTVDGVRLRIVQPNIPQNEKYTLSAVVRNWYRLTDLTEQPGAGVPTIAIWPESAPPFLIAVNEDALAWIRDINIRGTILMTGAIRGVRDEEGDAHYYNSFYIFDRGRPIATYDKSHLVPFGEYLPFEQTLEKWGLKKLTGINGSFGRGAGAQRFRVPGAPSAGPLICYEILFPDEVVGPERPGWLVNVTDDSWFGPWAGPRQHLLVARLRAIEEGLPVVRAANTGISAVIDPLGRITAELGLDRQGILDGALPSEIEATPYARIRGMWFALLLTVTLICTRRKRGRK